LRIQNSINSEEFPWQTKKTRNARTFHAFAMFETAKSIAVRLAATLGARTSRSRVNVIIHNARWLPLFDSAHNRLTPWQSAADVT
jgi:hypothetical protein